MVRARAHSAILSAMSAEGCFSQALWEVNSANNCDDRCAKYNYMFHSAYGDNYVRVSLDVFL